MSYPPLSPQGLVWAAVWGVVLSCCIWRPQISLSDRPPAVTDKTFGMQTVDHRVLAMCHTWRVVVTMYPKDWTSSKLSVTLVEPFTFAAAPSYGKTNSADWHLASGSYWHIHHRWQYRNHLWSSFFVPPPPIYLLRSPLSLALVSLYEAWKGHGASWAGDQATISAFIVRLSCLNSFIKADVQLVSFCLFLSTPRGSNLCSRFLRSGKKRCMRKDISSHLSLSVNQLVTR